MSMSELRRTHFPYCLQRLEDGRYVMLNRNYKPIGFLTGEWITYGDYPIGMKIKGLGPKTIAELDCQGGADPTTIFLYNDGSIPTSSKENMQAYLAKLAKLMALETEE